VCPPLVPGAPNCWPAPTIASARPATPRTLDRQRAGAAAQHVPAVHSASWRAGAGHHDRRQQQPADQRRQGQSISPPPRARGASVSRARPSRQQPAPTGTSRVEQARPLDVVARLAPRRRVEHEVWRRPHRWRGAGALRHPDQERDHPSSVLQPRERGQDPGTTRTLTGRAACPPRVSRPARPNPLSRGGPTSSPWHGRNARQLSSSASRTAPGVGELLGDPELPGGAARHRLRPGDARDANTAAQGVALPQAGRADQAAEQRKLQHDTRPSDDRCDAGHAAVYTAHVSPGPLRARYAWPLPNVTPGRRDAAEGAGSPMSRRGRAGDERRIRSLVPAGDSISASRGHSTIRVFTLGRGPGVSARARSG